MENPLNVEITSHRPGPAGRLIVAYKKLIRALIRPYLKHVFARVHIEQAMLDLVASFGNAARQLTRQNARLQSELEDAAKRIKSLEDAAKRIKSLEDAARAEAERLGSLAGRLDQALKRVEFVRNETMFEMRYGARPADARKTEKRVLDAGKLESMREVRLNVGCGHVPLEGYLNVDARELPGVDIVAAADDLPFDNGTVAEIYSSHLIEHFPQEELTRSVLPYWRALLKKGGVLRAVAPDWEKMVELSAKGDYPFEKLRLVTFGCQDYGGDFHYNMFSKESIRGHLEEAGFKDVTFPVTGRVNGDCFEFEVRAIKA